MCARVDQKIFETLGYRLDGVQAVDLEGEEIPGAVVMIDDEAASGHYDELTALKDIPFVVSNAACPGAFGDHLIASEGDGWVYAEALSDSNYPAVRVNRDGGIFAEDLATAANYWRAYEGALKAFVERGQNSINASESKP
ncbi:MAG: hypothetical protein ACRD1J_02045 [Terriglobia bacterium]